MHPDISLLHYPFEDKISPYQLHINAFTDQLIDQYDNLHDERKSAYKHSRFGELAGRFFPLASPQLLQAASRHMVVFFAFDDVYAIQRIKELWQACDKAITILEGHAAEADNENSLAVKLSSGLRCQKVQDP